MKERNLKGTWTQALLTFFGPIVLVFLIRFFLIEPFVIPSGSMIPTLLIHDHLFVFKSSFGLKNPFSNQWLLRWSEPNRGDIVVFRYPENPNVYYIKRVIGIPGDKIIFENRKLQINGEFLPTEVGQPSQSLMDEDFDFYVEGNKGKNHFVRYMHNEKISNSTRIEIDVPANKYFMMGDNRDQSSDSRVWGFVPVDNLVGRAWLIWLSCDSTLLSAQMVCDPLHIRWSRIFKKVDNDVL